MVDGVTVAERQGRPALLQVDRFTLFFCFFRSFLKFL